MKTKNSPRKNTHLILVGGGHAHAEVLRKWRMSGRDDVQLTLISPESETLYSGMLPGLVAGRYEKKDVVLDLHYLAHSAGATFVRDTVESLDPKSGKIFLRNRPPLHFDVISFDIGSRTAKPEFLPDSKNILLTRPFPVLMERLQVWDIDVRSRRQQIVAVGSGAAGFELILALRARYRESSSLFSIVDARGRLSSVQGKILREEGIEILSGEVKGVKEAGSGQLRLTLGNGDFVSADKLLWAAGPEAPPIFNSLPVREGFLLVNRFLQSVGDSRVFGAGDCVAFQDYPWVERAGVYAVREAPTLFQNLLTAVTREKNFRAYSPQRKFLRLLNTSNGSAIFDRKRFHFSAGWAFTLKERIDRKFIEKYRPKDLPPMADPECGGCGGKVAGDTLCNALAGVNPRHKEMTDDVAVVGFGEKKVAATVDEFKDFGVDPFLFGRIAAVGSASDLYAKGLKPKYALSIVQMPKLGGRIAEDFLGHWIAGAKSVFDEEGIEIIGGQTNESDAWRGGFSLLGDAGARFWPKGPPNAGDVLILTKPIGSGVVLAAAMQEVSVGGELDPCLAEMAKSAKAASAVLERFTVSAATDITGFSFLGHLREMLERGDLGVDLDWKQIPIYAGALQLFQRGYRSRMNSLNERAYPMAGIEGDAKILYTPETAGGILAAVPENEAESVVRELRKDYPHATIVGRIRGTV